MFLNKLGKKEKFKFMDLALYMVNVNGPSVEEEKKILKVMEVELGDEREEYSFNNSSKRENVDATVAYFKNKNSRVKRIVVLNLMIISFVDDIYSTNEHFFLEKVENELEINQSDRKKLLEIVYAERDLYETAKRVISE